MAIVHAYRRTRPHTVELGGKSFKFAANEDGHQVCDVPEGPALERLLELAEGYVAYGQVLPTAPGDDEDAPLSKYVLTRNENDDTIDLRLLDRAGLLAFIAEQELSYTPRANTPDDTLRDKIVHMLTGA